MYNQKELIENTKRYIKECKKFLVFLKERTKNDTIFRVAASLSYTSLIAIVPMLAVGLAIFSAFPVFSDVRSQLQDFILRNFVAGTEQEITQYFSLFVNATAKLTAIGVIGIIITAILMLSTIENSLNFIFKVHKSRSIKTKITLYWTVITLGPLLLGAAFSLKGYVFTLHKFMPEIDSRLFLSTIIPSIMVMLALIMLYVLVPNKKVKISNAFSGAFVSMILFWILRKGFGWAILKNSIYKTLYGALAALPVLLIWMFLAWAVVIFGAAITAAIEEYQQLGKEGFPKQVKKPYYKKNKNYAKKFLPKEQK